MHQFFRVFFWGMLVSFLGSLPLGTMNVTVTQISVQAGIRDGFVFAWGSTVIEVIIVRSALITMKWITGQHKLFRFLEYITISVILFLSIASFVAAYKMSGFASPLPVRSVNPFWWGAFLSLTNPLHIPFWIGWSTILMNKDILRPVPAQYNWYVAGIGLGSLLGFAVFIYAGNFLVTMIQQHDSLLNCVIGVVLLVTAMIQIYYLFVIPATVRYNK